MTSKYRCSTCYLESKDDFRVWGEGRSAPVWEHDADDTALETYTDEHRRLHRVRSFVPKQRPPDLGVDINRALWVKHRLAREIRNNKRRGRDRLRREYDFIGTKTFNGRTVEEWWHPDYSPPEDDY